MASGAIAQAVAPAGGQASDMQTGWMGREPMPKARLV
jgi:hypothetical protein